MLMDFLLDKLNICAWDFPRKEEIEKEERLLGNIGTTEEEAKSAKESLLEYYKKVGKY